MFESCMNFVNLMGFFVMVNEGIVISIFETLFKTNGIEIP